MREKWALMIVVKIVIRSWFNNFMYYNSFKFFLSNNIDNLLYIFMHIFIFGHSGSLFVTKINLSYIYIYIYIHNNI